ncbi:hypothetical protein Q428_02005 [Fervidicella metallireducens AeB]|uniref:CARDB domain-containing protein n=1 Tax=Fervidicella metallireducens AeB TaxID=1403537 RepID=A0A017RYG6_9CLOT|nr:hypothetical protein [Fervidicella metallireducens]EYE89601.1 hypothetical protein Q428_02005 [Fervidicella metallireducens AeB]
MKRIISKILIFIIVFCSFTAKIVMAEETNDIVVDGYSVDAGTIMKGYEFNITLNLKNVGSEDAKDVQIIIEPGSYYSKSYGRIIDTGKIIPANSSSVPIKFKLVYNGGEDTNFHFIVKYNGDKQTSNYVGINAIPDSKNNNPPSVDTNKVVPNLSFGDIEMPQVEAGEILKLDLSLKNLSSNQALNVIVKPLLGENTVFQVNKGNLVQKIEQLNSSKPFNMSYSFIVKKDAKADTYPITFKYTYENAFHDKFEDSETIYVKVNNISETKYVSLTIDNVKTSLNDIKARDIFEISFDVLNNGTETAENLTVNVDGGDFLICRSQDIKSITRIDAGKTYNVKFMFQSIANIESKNYPINIEIQYGKQRENVIKKKISVFISKEETAKGVPKVIISSYKVTPSIVKAGNNFDLEMSFLNTNSTKTVKNIKAFLTVDEKSSETGNIFMPVNSSNTFYIDEILPKESITKSITMCSVPDAKPKTYTITVNLEYEGSDGTAYTAQELVGITVEQNSQLRTGEIQLPPEAYLGQPFSISIDFYNTGKTKMSNLMIKTEGNFKVSKSSQYIGNFDIGSSDTYEVEIIPSSSGDLRGRIIFVYEDPKGNQEEVIRDFTLNVIDAPPMDPNFNGGEIQQEQSPKKLSRKTIIIVSVSSLVVLIALIIIVKKVRSRKKGFELDE